MNPTPLALLAAIAASGAGLPAPSPAQHPDAAAVQVAAVKAVRAEFPAGTIKVDRGMHGSQPRLLSDSVARVLADAVGGTVGSRADVVCPGSGPRGCRIVGAEALLRVAEPVVQGDSATVVVAGRYHTGSDRQPVGAKDLRVRLVRSAGRWIAVGTTVLRIS
ncbi:MAG TPA: hypothetical protein VHG51_12355 [Longimicrobiaceae bacterium]|nr:hypothetical protein [Longimicrobiaceae bacterium]